jgi:hypothetical protein
MIVTGPEHIFGHGRISRRAYMWIDIQVEGYIYGDNLVVSLVPYSPAVLYPAVLYRAAY